MDRIDLELIILTRCLTLSSGNHIKFFGPLRHFQLILSFDHRHGNIKLNMLDLFSIESFFLISFYLNLSNILLVRTRITKPWIKILINSQNLKSSDMVDYSTMNLLNMCSLTFHLLCSEAVLKTFLQFIYLMQS